MVKHEVITRAIFIEEIASNYYQMLILFIENSYHDDWQI